MIKEDPLIVKLSYFISDQNRNINGYISAIQAFKNKISFSWFENYLSSNPIDAMSYLWSLLFKIVDNSEATIRINGFNAIGSFIFSLSPFFPTTMRKSFSDAIIHVQISPHTSIAVICSFLYILQIVPPQAFDDFILNTPVLHHFGVDVSQFIQHIPRLVNLMLPLDIEFLQSLLRSLLVSFGRNPNHYFVESCCKLIFYHPEKLIDDFFEFVISNNLKQLIIAFSPYLFNSKEIYEHIKSKGKDRLLLDTCIETMNSDSVSFSEFENSCRTISLVIPFLSKEESADLLQRALRSNNQIPLHYRKYIYMIPINLENLVPNQNDSQSLKLIKIRTIPDYTIINNDSQTADFVYNIFLNACSFEGDLYVSFLHSFGKCFPFLYHFLGSKLTIILQNIFLKQYINWIQNLALLDLLKEIPILDGNSIFEGYEISVFNIILNLLLSEELEVFRSSLKFVEQNISMKTLPMTIDFLWHIDFFDYLPSIRFLYIINSMSNVLPKSFLKPFIGIVFEILDFHSSTETICLSYKFLTLFQNLYITENHLFFCLSWSSGLFKSLTQKSLIMPYQINHVELPIIQSLIDTDIIASDIKSPSLVLESLLHCFRFYSMHEKISQNIVIFAAQIVRVFPNDVISIVSSYLVEGTKDLVDFANAVSGILKSSCSMDVVTVCSKFLLKSVDVAISCKEDLLFFSKSSKIMNGIALSSINQLIYQFDTTLALELRKEIRTRLPKKELVLFDLNIGLYESFEHFVHKYNFSEWPLYNKLFRCQSYHLSSFPCDLSSLNRVSPFHQKYLFKYSLNHGIDSVKYPELSGRFVFPIRQYKCCSEKVNPTKIPSLIPRFANGTHMFSIPLLTSFFLFSSYQISYDLFLRVFQDIVARIEKPGVLDLCINALEYAKKMNFSIPTMFIKPLISQKNSKLLRTIIPFVKGNAMIESIVLDNMPNESLLHRINSKCFEWEHFIVSLKSEYYFELYLSSFEYKKKNFIDLCNFVQVFDLDTFFLLSLADRILSILNNVLSKSKSLYIIRLSCIILSQIISKSHQEESVMNNYINRFIQSTKSISNQGVASIDRELSYHYFILSKKVGSPKKILPDQFSTDFCTSPHHYSIFLECSLYISNFSQNFPKNLIISSLVSDIPSERNIGLQVIKSLLETKEDNLCSLVQPIFSNVLMCIQSLSSVFLSVELIRNLIQLILERREDLCIKPDIINEITNILLVSPKYPQFNHFSEIIVFLFVIQNSLPNNLCEFIKSGIKEPYNDYRIPDMYYEYTKKVLLSTTNDLEKGDIELESVYNVQKYFLNYPTLNALKTLYKSIIRRFEPLDAVYYIIGKLSMLENHFLYIYILFMFVIKRANDSERIQIVQLVNEVKDSLPYASRGRAFTEIIEKKWLKGGLSAALDQ